MNQSQTTYLGAGCFWGVQKRLSELEGVIQTRVGYAGGHTNEPTYKEVCTGTTNHAEVCEVIFDPTQIPFETLLTAFWHLHDPTTLNRQGPDFGTQYRSVVFCQNQEQIDQAQRIKNHLQQQGGYPGAPASIVTQILPNERFWEAEPYHQHYLKRR